MNPTIQKLKKIFDCQTIDELAKLLGLGRTTIFAYQRGAGGRQTERFIEIIEILLTHLPPEVQKECVNLINSGIIQADQSF